MRLKNPIRRRDYLLTLRQQAARMYKQGMTEQEIAEVMGVTRQRVAAYLSDTDVKKRPRGRRPSAQSQSREES